MQCSALYAGVQRRPRRLYTGMSTADVPMCADVVFVVTRVLTCFVIVQYRPALHLAVSAPIAYRGAYIRQIRVRGSASDS